MQLSFEEWFSKILALQKRFNTTKDDVTKFAILSTLRLEFTRELDGLIDWEAQFKNRATESILKSTKVLP